ncbi:MAG: HAMP domain-containing histidine kinase [Salinivirgaceae bacterium]|nr:HAMP domain-containing histidine kinase [Salinivirgaceae bacterium]
MNNFYQNQNRWKVVFIIGALFIYGVSAYFTNRIVKNMSVEERKRMVIWAEATERIAISNDGAEMGFYLNIIQNNTTIPVILTDGNNKVLSVMNLPQMRQNDSAYCQKRIAEMQLHHEPIVVELGQGLTNIIYYDDSTILRQLSVFPIIQLGVVSLFVVLAYFAFSSARKAEQNGVWVGMSKETAHQLGTPISSLMAWNEILKQEPNANSGYLSEMQKDVDRLQMIADRFSKVGSLPDLQPTNLNLAIAEAVDYMRARVSSNINISVTDKTTGNVQVALCASLFNWVIENLIKNAMDAMNGRGSITISITEQGKQAVVLVSDTGKGLPKSKFKTVFNPGYTTKQRGWGLGLSLAKRIIEDYHCGKIIVSASEINVGTTFKITLPIV